MRKAIKLRTLTTEEITEIKQISASHKAPIRRVQRARVIALMVDNPKLHASEADCKLASKVSRWGPSGCDASTNWD
jgi:hypothetical protein